MNADTLPQNHEALSVYNRMIEVFFYFKSLEDLNETVHEHFMGFGTAAHEFFKNREELSGMARMQAEQLRDQEFTLKRMPVTAKLLDSDTTCLIVEEFELKMHTNEHRLSLRLSTILENIDGKWLVTHFHGSTPDSDIAEEEAFPEEGLKRKNEELEARIKERTRELEIEAALERTRGQSLQMQHSSELNEISKIFHQQIRMLGIDSEFSFVWLPNEAAGNHLFWTAWMEGSDPSSKVYTREITYPLDKTESYTAACFTDWESGVPVHEHFVKPEDLDTFFASWEELLAGASKLKAAFFPEGIYYTEAFIKYGCFGIDTRAPLTNEEKSILHRFAVEFERTYTRFLELKKAEAQAREAQVEAALERVRARTMAMQHSDELAEASHLLDKEVRDLGIKTWGCAFNIYREKDAIEWFGNEQGLLPTYTVPREGIFKEYYDLGQEGETLYVKEFSGAECIAHYEYMSTLPVVGDVLKQLKKTNGSFPSYQMDHVVFFKHGYLLFITREPVPEAYDIFRRFAKVFEQTYTRFLDLQKAEAQAREARIENALEKVRSRSIGMQKSEELREVIQVIHDQLIQLNFQIDAAGFTLDYHQNNDWNVWIANKSGSLPSLMFIPYIDHPQFNHYKYAKEKGLDFLANTLTLEEKNSIFMYMFRFMGDYPQAEKDELLSKPGLAISQAFLKNISLWIYNLDAIPYSEEENDTLMRFAKVFEQTYVRFNDLQKAEAQARESQIELALERIRAQVTGMQESSELLDIVVTMRSEFVKLGHEAHYFWHMRWLPDTYKKAMTSGDGTRIGMVMELPRHIHGDIPLLATWEKSKKPTVVYAMDAEAAVDYVDKMVTLGNFQQVDPQAPGPDDIRAIGGLTFVMARTTHGEIGYSLPGEVPDPPAEDLETLVRFAAVFDLAYRRFEDLKESERQKREAEIELALERVRARTMAMQKSEELADVAFVLFEQLKSLGGNLWGTGFGLCEKNSELDQFWFAHEKGVLPPTAIPNTVDSAHKRMYECWINNGDFLTIEASGEALKSHYDYVMSLPEVRPFFQDILDKGLSFPEWQQWNAAYFTHGYLLIISLEPYPEPDILKRFAKVFDQTYTRFLDLRRAEAQAREAQIEAALERVRAGMMAMHKSDELRQVIKTIFEQLQALDFGADGSAVIIYDENYGAEHWFSGYSFDTYPKSYTIPYIEKFKYNTDLVDAWRNGVKYQAFPMEGKEKTDYGHWLLENTEFKDLPEEFTIHAITPDRLVLNDAFNKYGMLEVLGPNELSEENADILKRFSKVFEQTYTRFLDLQRAEVQAREAQIEASLERVRSRTMGMQKSEELKEVIRVIFDQLALLNINAEHAGIVVDYEPGQDWNFWIAETQDIPSRISVPYLDLPWDRQFAEAKEKGKDFFTTQLNFEEKNSFYEKLLPHIPGITKKVRDFYFKCPGLAISTVLKNDVGLYIENFTGTPYTDEENEILMRFGKVFQQTYTRFLDLKKAEAQAREAKIEAALEKVRTRTMAMQKGEELKEVVVLLYKELIALGVDNFVTCGYVEINEEINRQFTWVTTPGGDTLGLFYLPLTGDATFDERHAAWKRQQSVFHQTVAGEVRNNHLEYAITTFNSKEAEDMVRSQFPDPTVFYCFNFSHGYLHLVAGSKLKEEEELLLARFTRVFEQTYARFLDLQQAEAQAREAQIENALEKVRSRTMAMQHSDELPEAANVLFLEVQALGIPAWSAGYCIWEAKDKKAASCNMSSEGELQKSFILPTIGEGYDFYTPEKRGESFFVKELGGQALVAHYEFMRTLPTVGEILDGLLSAGLSLPTFQIFHIVYFPHGYLMFITYEPVPDSHEIFQRFGKVFEQTYTRFLDLKRAEAQARESKIETALERVRARALAMQRPEELKEVAQVMRREMGLLGVEELETSSIYIHDQEEKKTECWYAIKDIREEEKVMVADHFVLDLKDTWVGREMLKFYETKQEQVSIVMKGDARKEWIVYCEKHSKALQGYYGEVIPERTYHLYKFSHGAIGVATPADLSEESWGLLKRAASVFSLAYSRFKDLTQARLDLQRLKEEKKRAEDALKELQLTQQQLVHAEKMASLGELTAGIAHEIKNPLNFVNNFSEVTRELVEEMIEELKNGDAEEADAIASDVIQNLEKIVHHGQRADSIVRGMLQHSRSGDGQKEPTDLNALADEYLRLAYHGLRAQDKSFNSAMETELDGTLGQVNIVPQEIGRVLLNLLTNAFHAVSEKKQKKPEGYQPTVTIKTKKAGKGVEIRVSDNGDGIPEKIRDKIFQPFFTTKPTGQGTGLGLSMSYDIITKGHEGKMKVTSEIGKGTTFTVTLPGN